MGAAGTDRAAGETGSAPASCSEVNRGGNGRTAPMSRSTDVRKEAGGDVRVPAASSLAAASRLATSFLHVSQPAR